MRIALPLLAALLLAAGCSREAPVTASTSASSGASQQAEARLGDAVVHASVVQTSTLDAAIAQRYGLERSDRLAMLLVSVRRADGADGPVPDVRVEASAGPTGAAPQPVSLRELRVDGLVDRVGTVAIAPPETLQFELTLRYGGATSTMRFTRDFFAR